MPLFTINTNVASSKIPDALLVQLTDVLAEQLNKPTSYICVEVNGDRKMIWDKSSDPCGEATLLSIGAIGPAENKAMAKRIYPLIEKHLGISGKRFYIHFIDAPRPMMGFDGGTF